MKRELNAPFMASFVGLSRFVEKDKPCRLVAVVDNSELNRLLSLVFAADDTGAIQGDIGMLLSDKVDPQIVAFVKQQLLFDTTSSAQSPLPSWMSDDDALQMRRNGNESMDDYAERMASLMLKLKDDMKPQKDN